MSDRSEADCVSNDLMEKAKQAVKKASRCWGVCAGATPDGYCLCEVSARAAIAVALEEAAKVADGWVGCPEWSPDTNSGYECASREIAASIRALKEK